MTADTERLVEEIVRVLYDDAPAFDASGKIKVELADLSPVAKEPLRRKAQKIAALLSPAGREGEIERLHAGELCTYGPPQERKAIWIVKFEDASRGESHFNNEQEAISFFLKASDSWTCTLLTTVRIASPTPALPTVREGWKLVPVEPTHEMCPREQDVHSYRSALAASPLPGEQK